MNVHPPVIEARNLTIEYRIGKQWLQAVTAIDLSIAPRQIHGLVGESGSGKSTLGLGIMRYLAANSRITGGEIYFDDHDLVSASREQLQRIWGKTINLVPQNPLDSLNPSLKIGAQMAELTRLHAGQSAQEARATAIQALRTVRIADAEQVIERYPHQLSGGMQQRVMIAMALSTRPRLLVLDEPTTALDVTTQAVILDLIRDLIHEEQAAALYVSHDLGTVAQLCDHVTVLYAGEIMESAPVDDLFARPLHPYTIGLLGSIPAYTSSSNARLSTIQGIAPALTERSQACVFAGRCPIAIERCHQQKPPLEATAHQHLVRCWRSQEIASGEISASNQTQGIFETASATRQDTVFAATNLSKRFEESSWIDRLTGQKPVYVQAVQDVSLQVPARSTIGLVGESGSGKTTLARLLVALVSADHGTMSLKETPISLHLRERDPETLREIRMIFQNPNDALNPYRTVGQVIGRTYQMLKRGQVTSEEIHTRVEEVLQSVGLPASYATRYPQQLSGGEKQRVAIARAFVAQPTLIVADEPTSSLDVSVQANILNLLKDLRAESGTSYILISHDLDVINYLADWLIVMYLGEIMEQGPAQAVYDLPMHPYTEALLSASPRPDPANRQRGIRLEGELPSPRNKPSGCPFHTRCPRFLGKVCIEQHPPLQRTDSGHEIRCHIPLADLKTMQEA